jgi:hypothetical protein
MHDAAPDENLRVRAVTTALIAALDAHCKATGESDFNMVVSGIMLFFAENIVLVANYGERNPLTVFADMVPALVENMVRLNNAILLNQVPAPTEPNKVN